MNRWFLRYSFLSFLLFLFSPPCRLSWAKDSSTWTLFSSLSAGQYVTWSTPFDWVAGRLDSSVLFGWVARRVLSTIRLDCLHSLIDGQDKRVYSPLIAAGDSTPVPPRSSGGITPFSWFPFGPGSRERKSSSSRVYKWPDIRLFPSAQMEAATKQQTLWMLPYSKEKEKTKASDGWMDW